MWHLPQWRHWDGALGMQLIDALLDLCSEITQPIIAIDGPAGAGKTTLAHDIKLALAQRYSVTEIHMDDLYDGWDNALTHQLTDVLTNLVAAHKKSAAISLSTYDWRAGAFSPVAEIEKSELLILEGVGSGQMAVRDSLAALIWIDIEESEGLARVIARDGKEIESQMRKWLATQEQHFLSEGTQNAADFVLTT
jgi:uridine kinase